MMMTMTTMISQGGKERALMGLEDLVEASKGVATDIRKNMAATKERLLEKLTAAAVPAEALDKARRFLETVVKDATLAAHGLTKDAFLRIKTHLVDLLLPFVSPTLTTKVIEDAEKEANVNERNSEDGGQPFKYVLPSSRL